MEVRDGFIVGVFNFCDRWCERCSLTAHCRVFANVAEMEASLDPSLKAVADAPPLPEEVPPPLPRWMQEMIEEMNEAARNPPSPEEWEQMRPRVDSKHAPLERRARDYGARTYGWLKATQDVSVTHGDARETIAWFHTMIQVKINRALTTWPGDDSGDMDCENDGSAKVALLAIDRSHAAWLDLVERGVVTVGEAERFIADLVWLGEALESARPRARAFVRPAFDEPDALARFLAHQRASIR